MSQEIRTARQATQAKRDTATLFGICILLIVCAVTFYAGNHQSTPDTRNITRMQPTPSKVSVGVRVLPPAPEVGSSSINP